MRIVKDGKVWNTVLDGFIENDLYFKYEYFDLYKKHYNLDFEAIFWENDYIKVFWPHLIRNISKLDKFKDFNFYDSVTPYGYGGPLINLKVNNQIEASESIKSFAKYYKDYVSRNNFVSEFLRFHPIFKNWKMLDNLFNVEYLNDVIIMDLTRNLNEIWKDFRKGHKYDIKKSIMKGCVVKFINNPSKEEIDNFIKLYYKTMDKNKAAQKYYFSEDFIGDHFKFLNAILVQAEYGDDIIGSNICLYENDYIHYHLSGSVVNVENVYPSHLMIFELIKWAKERNIKYFNFGGGRGSNDSLFRFKKGFSKMIRPFYVAKLIYNNDVYDELTNINYKSVAKDYFPSYRFGLDEDIL